MFLRVVDHNSSDSSISPDDFFSGKVLKCSNNKRSAFILMNAHMNVLICIPVGIDVCIYRYDFTSFYYF